MFIPKKYGQSKIDNCPFCGKHATAMNGQDVPVCMAHKDELLDDLKCVCGSILEMLHGKFGIFFKCVSCGNKSLRKVLEFNTIKPKLEETKNEFITANKFQNKPAEKNQSKKIITVRSDDPRYFD